MPLPCVALRIFAGSLVSNEVFIFSFIESRSVSSHKDLVNLFAKLIKEDSKLNGFFQDWQNTSFLLTQDAAKGIYGGALLHQTKLNSLPSKIARNLRAFSLLNGKIWACTFCFHLKDNNFPSELEIYFKDLYKNLYKELSHFGAREKTSILYMMLQPGEYLCSGVLGFWPYRLEINPNESSDGLFHGILPLVRAHSRTFPKSYERNISSTMAF